MDDLAVPVTFRLLKQEEKVAQSVTVVVLDEDQGSHLPLMQELLAFDAVQCAIRARWANHSHIASDLAHTAHLTSGRGPALRGRPTLMSASTLLPLFCCKFAMFGYKYIPSSAACNKRRLGSLIGSVNM